MLLFACMLHPENPFPNHPLLALLSVLQVMKELLAARERMQELMALQPYLGVQLNVACKGVGRVGR